VHFLRLAFRLAQQAWTRTARSEAVLGARDDSAMRHALALFRRGVVPLGVRAGALHCFRLDERAPRAPRVDVHVLMSLARAGSRRVFLSGAFDGPIMTLRLTERFAALGWKPYFGPLPERDAPLERRLARRVHASAAVVGIVDEIDPDFGLPLWVHQELDYAAACGRPVALASPAPADAPIPGVTHVPCEPVALASDAAHPLFAWLASTVV
jgi:hypothetical protein